jgi:hypothetical protein
MKTIKRYLEELIAKARLLAARRRAMHGAVTAAWRMALNGCRL